MKDKIIKKTFSELREIDAIVGQMYGKDPSLRNTKFGYSFKKFSDKNFIPTLKNYLEKIEEIRINNALENPSDKSVILDQTNPRGFKYSKEGLKKCVLEERECYELFNLKEITVDPYISSLVPKNLSEQESELLKGLLI